MTSLSVWIRYWIQVLLSVLRQRPGQRRCGVRARASSRPGPKRRGRPGRTGRSAPHRTVTDAHEKTPIPHWDGRMPRYHPGSRHQPGRALALPGSRNAPGSHPITGVIRTLLRPQGTVSFGRLAPRPTPRIALAGLPPCPGSLERRTARTLLFAADLVLKFTIHYIGRSRGTQLPAGNWGAGEAWMGGSQAFDWVRGRKTPRLMLSSRGGGPLLNNSTLSQPETVK